MALSMTGFGASDGAIAGFHARVDLRTVNHRFFHCTLRLPSELASVEAGVRAELKARISRGHVTLSVVLDRDDDNPAATLDSQRARKVHDALTGLSSELGLTQPVSLDAVIRFPDVVTNRRPSVAGIALDDFRPMLESAIEECLEARRREGVALTNDVAAALDSIASLLTEVEELVPERLTRELSRLRSGISELAGGVTIDENRLAQEIAVLADKLDVNEEITRLRAHLDAASDALSVQAPVGKQLGFLAQEIGREVNTIGSKANDAGIAHLVVAMKTDLERIREQLENLE